MSFEILRLAEHLARMRTTRTAYRILVGKSLEKRLLWRPKRRREDNGKKKIPNLQKWMKLSQDCLKWRTLFSAILNLPV